MNSRPKTPIDYRIIVYGVAILFAPVWVPLIVALMVLLLLYWMLLYLAVWTWWLPRGKDVLIVYSNSPIWHDYMTEKIIASLQHRAIILNWSERKQWRRTLAVFALRAFGGGREFNPMVMVFRPFRLAKKYRYWEPFRYWKRGNTEPVEAMTRELLGFLRITE
ncbi:MAG TPA: hypothetical protein VF493_11490 [Terriglobales bacterium]